MAAYTLRLIQPSMGVTSASVVEPVLQLLRSLHLDVQHEGIQESVEKSQNKYLCHCLVKCPSIGTCIYQSLLCV